MATPSARPSPSAHTESSRTGPALPHQAGYAKGYYWETRADTVGESHQRRTAFILVPKGEGRPTLEQVAVRLNEDAVLQREFVEAMGAEANPDTVIKALASFVRTLVPAQSAWVRFHDGDASALSEKARRGYEIFDRKARCSNCHSGVLLTDRLKHDIGTGGTFKTPTLLNIGRSAPYFHDNRMAALDSAVDQMIAGGFTTKTPDPQLKPAELTAEERELLLAFLRELDADV